MQLLVLGRSRGEDGRHAQDGGGSGWVPHLVDHDGGQDHTQDLQDKAGVRKRPKQPVPRVPGNGTLPASSEPPGYHRTGLTARMARVKITPITMSTANRM